MTKDKELAYLVKLNNNTNQRKGFLVFYADEFKELHAYECGDLFRLKESMDRLHPEYELLYGEPYFIPAEAKKVCILLSKAREYRQRAFNLKDQVIM